LLCKTETAPTQAAVWRPAAPPERASRRFSGASTCRSSHRRRRCSPCGRGPGRRRRR
jgi:hypothetical protein